MNAALARALAPFAPAQSEVHQILAATVHHIPPEEFNTDDFYVYDQATLRVIRQVGSKLPKPEAQLGEAVARGMSAKYLGLWKS